MGKAWRSFCVSKATQSSYSDMISSMIQSNVLNFFPNEMKSSSSIDVDGNSMTIEKLIALGDGTPLSISPETIQRLQQSRDIVDRIVESKVPTYGINTGFGLMSHTNVSYSQLCDLQHNLIRSHASGVGEPLHPSVVRRIMALRINTLARGKSGVSLDTFKKLVDLFNTGCTPEVPSQGTVGASGDLAPLAHIALGLSGEGLIHNPRTNAFEPAPSVLREYNLEPAKFVAKDGLSLVNGTQFITGVGSQALEAGIICAQVAQPIAALTLVALNGHMNAFDARVHECRPHVGSATVARIVRGLVPPNSHTTTDKDVQDFYSLRCVPQIHGTVLESLVSIRHTLETEMNSSTDNPLIFDPALCPITNTELPCIISAGNFHGEYPAKALDTLALYVGELGRASVARSMLMIDPNRNRGLPAFVVNNPGVNSGFMCWELTAAALDAENRTLSMPASAETANTGAGKEDHVSMGGFSARKAVQVVENVQKMLAIELLMTTHALHTRFSNKPNFMIPKELSRVFVDCASMSPRMDDDRYLKTDYEAILGYIQRDLPLKKNLVNPMSDSSSK